MVIFFFFKGNELRFFFTSKGHFGGRNSENSIGKSLYKRNIHFYN